MDIYEESLEMHEKFRGKLGTYSKVPLNNKKDLSLAYTPGVAEPSRRIGLNKEEAYKYTNKGNMVAVISNGTAVLGLGDIGAYGAIPVMEGKAILFKELAGIDAFPICINSKDVQENIRTIRNIAPVFGGINLEDYRAPECFEIENALQDLGIPVMHDDQHGTAMVVLGGMINALRVVGKKKEEVHIVINGAGAAGTAIMKLLLRYGFRHIIMLDSKGAISSNRNDLNEEKKEIVKLTGNGLDGDLKSILGGKDIFIGVSKGNLLNEEMVRSMNKDAIVFALANPAPEIMPDVALKGGAKIVATGRSDFPNQVNNSLIFPGVFRGALDCRATRITTEMKLAAAEALAGQVVNLSKDNILPPALDKGVVKAVAEAVKKAWRKENE
ncbi:MAG: NADP-dependent malic enzyme [Nanoarchaeota archaeon]